MDLINREDLLADLELQYWGDEPPSKAEIVKIVEDLPAVSIGEMHAAETNFVKMSAVELAKNILAQAEVGGNDAIG